MNILLKTDSYKTSHFAQYPQGTDFVSSYIEARGGKFEKVLFSGLQGLLLELAGQVVTKDDVLEAKEICEAHGVPFNEEGWMIIVNEHDGRLPVEIQALPEGFVTRHGVPLVQIVNTDPRLPWLTSYLETALLRAIWYPTTVGSLSRAVKEIIYTNLAETSDDPEAEINFKLHDFGARGAAASEAAAIGGTAHLLNFMGTDTLEAIYYARRVYGAAMAGFSIPASEHSTITSWGREGEVVAYENMIDQFGGEGKLFACVSDSYDIFKACADLWGGVLKEKVINNGGTLVVRPDSGDPVEITLKVIQILEERFGTTINSKGYKVLPPYIRIIQGDGVNIESIKTILDNYKAHGYSGSNIAFGMGGALLQKVDRDTMKFAMKANEVIIGGVTRDVYKDPITDNGKTSKKGRQAVVAVHHGHVVMREDEMPVGAHNYLQPVFRNGKILKRWTFDEARAYASL